MAKLMRQAQIVPRSVRRFLVTTDSRNTLASADLVQRRFEAQQPNQCWLSDVTYIPTREGWLYLAAVLDLYSRAAVGWAMSRTLGTPLVIDALDMALRQRGRGPAILHSDRGCTYSAANYRQILAEHGIPVLQPPAAALDDQLRGPTGLRGGTSRLITVSTVRG